MVDLAAAALVVAGVAFMVLGTVGVVRLPDFYSRAHAVAKAEALGLLLVVMGLAVSNGLARGTPQLLFIAVFTYLANSTAIHVLARVAWRGGERPWRREARG